MLRCPLSRHAQPVQRLPVLRPGLVLGQIHWWRKERGRPCAPSAGHEWEDGSELVSAPALVRLWPERLPVRSMGYVGAMLGDVRQGHPDSDES